MTKIVIADDHARRAPAACGCCSTARTASRSSPRPATSPTPCATSARTGPTCWCSTSTCRAAPASPAIPACSRSRRARAIVVLTMQEDPAFAREALQAGALGYVLKEAADEELVEAVRAAADGDTYLNPRLGARLAAAPPGAGRPARRPHRARGRGPAADRARPHQRRDRPAAVPERPHRRDAPRAHPAEAAAHARAPSSSATRSTTASSPSSASLAANYGRSSRHGPDGATSEPA